ncbi:MAG TPA: AAA family ATPase [Lacipirellulaceae bacterium]|nr:AAA family ATPase [Lacipirellulaceae bacterium]
MYLDYWQLDAKPFEPHCEPAFVYAPAAHHAALHKLRYAIENRRAAGVVAGPAGSGKTLLVELLRRSLDASCQPLVQIVFPQMTERDLLVYLAEHLGAPPADPPRYTVEESLRRLEFVLRENVRRGRHAIIVIDEAHLLEDTGLMEPLRLLLNLTVEGAAGFTLLLVGQPGLLPMVGRHGALDQRLDVKAFLPTFSPEETAAYVRHRLDAAGATREIFGELALLTVHQLSGGVPRRINRLCDLALLVGYANGDQVIAPADLHAVHDELVAVTPTAAAA